MGGKLVWEYRIEVERTFSLSKRCYGMGLVVSTAYLVDGSYNPFLYFRF